MWRIEQRMLERDDEDLAVEQLLDPFIGAGREGDAAVLQAPDPVTPVQERGAEPAPARAPGEQQRLVVLREERGRLEAQRQVLPARRLGQLDAINEEYKKSAARLADHSERLAQLPPAPRMLGDRHAGERRHLETIVDSNREHMAALERQHKALRAQVTHELGRDAKEVKAELRGIDHRTYQVDQEQHELRATLATRAVSQPPAWVEQTIGPRPGNDDRGLGDWKNAIRRTTDAQLRIDPSRPLDAGLPEAPVGGEGLRAWNRAQEAIQTANRRLGRDVAGPVRDIGPELDLGL